MLERTIGGRSGEKRMGRLRERGEGDMKLVADGL
jgi:hypothetical protein